jgi:hypothetical protein
MIDALPYLVEYPYGCTEQTLNRFLPTVIVRKAIGDGWDLETADGRRQTAADWAIARNRSPVFDREQIDEMVRDGVARLVNMQCSDGGWGWFSGWGERSSAHLTALVLRGLLIAMENDVAVDGMVLRRGLDWLLRYQKEELRKLKNGELSEEERQKLSRNDWKTAADELDAFVYMVIVEFGAHLKDNDENRFIETDETIAMKNYLWRDRGKLSLYGVSMFGIALASSMDRTFESVGFAFSIALSDDTEITSLLDFSSGTESKKAAITKEDMDKMDACIKILEQYLAQDNANQTAYLNLRGYPNWR